MPLLFHGCEVGSDDAKGIGAVLGTKGTSDLLFEFWHADSTLCQVVVEWDAHVRDKAEHIVTVVMQTTQEIDGISLLDAASTPGSCWSLGIKQLAFCQEGMVAFLVTGDALNREILAAVRGNFFFGGQEQIDHLLWPGLFGCFSSERVRHGA